MTLVTKYVDVEIDIDLEEFSDEELIDECKDRKIWPGENRGGTTHDLVEILYNQYTSNKDITQTLRDLFYTELGRIL